MTGCCSPNGPENGFPSVTHCTDDGACIMDAAVGKDKVANVLLPQRARGGADSALLAAQEIARSSAREVLSPLLDTACARLSAVLRRAFDIAVDSASNSAEGMLVGSGFWHMHLVRFYAGALISSPKNFWDGSGHHLSCCLCMSLLPSALLQLDHSPCCRPSQPICRRSNRLLQSDAWFWNLRHYQLSGQLLSSIRC